MSTATSISRKLVISTTPPMTCYQVPLMVRQHYSIPFYWHVCYSEYKNRLVHVAKSSQVFPYNSILHTYPLKGFCCLKRRDNQWDLMIQILILTLPGFILCFSFSCCLVSSMVGFLRFPPTDINYWDS